MRPRVDPTDAPTWSLAAAAGLLGAFGIGLFEKLSGSSGREPVVHAVVVGIICGVAVGFSLNRRRREERAVAGDLGKDQLRLARRAAENGPIPDDPEVRAAAHRLAVRQLETCRRRRKLHLSFGVIAVIGGVGLFVESRWFFFVAPLNLYALIGIWRRPWVVERHVEALAAAVDE